MSPRRRLFNFAIDDDLAAGLKAIKARTGVSESEQVRRAIQMWLESQGEMKKAERKRAATRKTPPTPEKTRNLPTGLGVSLADPPSPPASPEATMPSFVDPQDFRGRR